MAENREKSRYFCSGMKTNMPPFFKICLLSSFLFLISLAVARPVPGDPEWPMPDWSRATPAEVGMDEGTLLTARDYALSGGGSGYITRGGKLILSWGDLEKRYDLKSTTKSIGVTALGLALKDGKMKLGDRARLYHPELGIPPQSNREAGWLDKITLFHLATQTAGFDKDGGFTELLFDPGTQWSYSDGGPNWLAECITLVYQQDLQELMFERVFGPLGIQRDDLKWRENAYREATITDGKITDSKINGVGRREFGSGIHANVDAMARIGYLYLRRGRWGDEQIIPESFVDEARRVQTGGLPVFRPEVYPEASSHYGLLWWNNADGTLASVPRDAYWSWGLYDSLIVVIPSLDIVIARAGSSWDEQRGSHYGKLGPFLEPIVASVIPKTSDALPPPYPPSPLITGIRWAKSESIVRKAEGGDNWPMTWADDGALYTAYGDGWGFIPKVPKKLSMGFARITGSPADFTGTNLRSPTGEQVGQGAAGKKASGMLMVDAVLYLWVRNAGNSQLAWSLDRGKTWKWSKWQFTTSFGHPTFLNFGKNYASARDGYVYIYSHDSDSAYEPSDRMVLARVPKQRITERAAYEFFGGLDTKGEPGWTKDISRREAVFVYPGRCYRSSVTYNPALKRYLWCQIVPGDDTRFEGGFGVYDAPQPWGPWTTVYFTEKWDVGPGENCSFPTKWMSSDGKTLHLVFSGDDYFSVRKAELTLRKK